MGLEPGSYQVTARQAAFARATSISSRRIILRATGRSGFGSGPSRGGSGHYRSQGVLTSDFVSCRCRYLVDGIFALNIEVGLWL